MRLACVCACRLGCFHLFGVQEAGFNVEGKKEADSIVVEAPEHAMVDLLRKSFDLEPVKAGAKQWRMVDAGVGMGSSVGSGDWGGRGARMELWK